MNWFPGTEGTHFAGVAMRTPAHGLGGLKWHITVLSRDSQEILSHTLLDDWEECKAYCTERRSENLSSKIYFKPPAGETEEWA